MNRTRNIPFDAACRQFSNRFTVEHVPAWARKPAPNGKFYAPQYASDHEWYERTAFPGEPEHILGKQHGGACDSRHESWPVGQWLDAPFISRRVSA